MLYILKQLINKKVIEKENIIFIDFSSFLENNFDIKKLLENYYELYPNKTPFFIFDEIQELKDFSKIVLYIFNK
jgi:predicted AAA+ superfamily ATPase